MAFHTYGKIKVKNERILDLRVQRISGKKLSDTHKSFFSLAG
jgi:hypothetical protein